jgi:phosphatidylserine decarboxylase
MKHSGKASQAGLRLILWTLILLLVICGGGMLAVVLGSLIASVAILLLVLWALFALFTLYFFRDPEARVPQTPNAIVAPAHGKVDLIDESEEPIFVGGRCQRISVFLSVIDVHVQRAPVAGRVALVNHTPGQFLSALKAESALLNEQVLIGIESSERPGERIGVRLIAGVLARRIVPWVAENDVVARGERLSLIQFGSRCNLYLPLGARIQVKLGEHVVGGETVMAMRD